MTNNRLLDGLSLLISSDRRTARINSIPITRNTSDEHWWAVTKLAHELVKQGCSVVAEATFYAGRLRADLYIPELQTVIEVLHSENNARLEKKKNDYSKHKIPVNFTWTTTTEVASRGATTIINELISSRIKRGPDTKETRHGREVANDDQQKQQQK